jgi:hypothetical protein
MQNILPFCKLISGYTTTTSPPQEVNFTDSAGNPIFCNYLNVQIAGSLGVADIFELEFVGVSGLANYDQLGQFANLTTSGAFGIAVNQTRPAEIYLPNGLYATGVKIRRTIGTVSRNLIFTYGLITENTNPLSTTGLFKGV